MRNKKVSYGYYEPDNEHSLYGHYEVYSENDRVTSSRLTQFFKKHLVSLFVLLLLLIFIVIALLPAISITIHAGERGVMYHRFFNQGVDLDRTYKEGLHLVWPWDIMTVYSIRIQEMSDHVTVLSEQGMEIEMALSIRYHPHEHVLPKLHEEIGPLYAQSVVLPEVEGSVLSIFGSRNIEKIYTNIYQLIALANETVKKDLDEKHIAIDDLIVKEIKFPPAVRDAVNEKIKQRQIALAYAYKLQAAEREAKRKTIEAEGINSFQSIVSQGISENYLRWKGIDATLKLAESKNSKVVVIGSVKDGLPLILNTAADHENGDRNVSAQQ